MTVAPVRSHTLAHSLLALPDGPVEIIYDESSMNAFHDEGIGAWDLGIGLPTTVTIHHGSVLITIKDGET